MHTQFRRFHKFCTGTEVHRGCKYNQSVMWCDVLTLSGWPIKILPFLAEVVWGRGTSMCTCTGRNWRRSMCSSLTKPQPAFLLFIARDSMHLWTWYMRFLEVSVSRFLLAEVGQVHHSGLGCEWRASIGNKLFTASFAPLLFRRPIVQPTKEISPTHQLASRFISALAFSEEGERIG